MTRGTPSQFSVGERGIGAELWEMEEIRVKTLSTTGGKEKTFEVPWDEMPYLENRCTGDRN